MEYICSLRSYPENVDDLKQKLLYTTLELEAARMELKEEMRKNEENVKHLLGLLKLAYHERDEAKSNLQKLFYKFLPAINPQQFESETPFLKLKQANKSSITESNNSCFSNNSSPVDSVFDVASSSPPQLPVVGVFNVSDSSNMTFVNNTNQQSIVFDRASMIINNLVRGKPLPEKGRLSEAVKQASEFLQRHLVGELPKWRNPPPFQPHFIIPPISIGGSSQDPLKQHGTSCLINTSSPYDEMMPSSGSSQFISAPMSSFGTGASGSYTNNRQLSSGIVQRQRMQ